jgi:phosphate starvation-inducible protein PhoH and related proteins
MSSKKQKYPQPENPESRKFGLKQMTPRNDGQKFYMDAIRDNKLVLCAGPAGTGKTFLAVYVACEALMNGDVERIIVTRPIVEAGERLGFLPGDFEEKVHPYLLPILDSFEAFLGPTMTQKLLDDKKIEIAPLAYMRGRTFNNCFAILDEAQNTTRDQIKLFMTRMGFNSTFVINGDDAQSDLPDLFRKDWKGQNMENGLGWAVRKLAGKHSDIYVHEFSHKEIVRNPLIQTILTHLESPEAKDVHPSRPETRHDYRK